MTSGAVDMEEQNEVVNNADAPERSSLGRDVVVLAVLALLLYGLTQFTSLDVVGNLQQTFGSGYTVTNNCAFPLVVATDIREVARAESAETITFQPPANGEIFLEVGGSERTRFTLSLPALAIELTGKSFPSRSDFYGTDATLIACPKIDT